MPHREYFANHKNDLLGMLRRVVELESPTSDKSAVDACSAFVVEQFRRLGASIRRHPQSDTDMILIQGFFAFLIQFNGNPAGNNTVMEIIEFFGFVMNQLLDLIAF